MAQRAQAGTDAHRDQARAELLDWFDRFARCVRERDFEGGERLFDPDVVAFGTRNEMMLGLAALREMQWLPTWNSTRDFRFVEGTLHIDVCPAGELAWGGALWASRGEPGDRPGFDRRGRATFGFARGECWRCTHSHLSLTPSGTL